jgi:spermidine synthase
LADNAGPGATSLTATSYNFDLRNPYLRLFLASFAVLFLELALIRWIPAYLRSFGFFTNFVLLASLLGTGVGILTHRGSRIPIPPLAVTLIALIAVALLNQYSLVIATTEVLFYGSDDSLANESYWVIPVIFTLLAVTFMPLGRELGKQFSVLPPLPAYTADIIGSLAGIASFVALAYASLPPIYWFLLFFVVAWPLVGGKTTLVRLINGAIFVAILGIVASAAGIFGSENFQNERDVWSPYYRIQYRMNGDRSGYIVSVNNIGHQEAKSYVAKEQFYLDAYRLLGRPAFKRVLIIGAGTGSDVAAALANGAEHVDAVEIDPQLHALGVRLHPDRPYDDPRVTVTVDDGRAFVRHTDAKYDLIIFALTDSLTLTSSQANLRLESFLFTAESMREASEHLTDNGLLVLYNYYRQDWSVKKLASMLESAFNAPPYVASYGAWGRAAVLMSGPRLASLPADRNVPYVEHSQARPDNRIGGLPEVGRGRLSGDPTLKPAIDDWPFFYLHHPQVPPIYLWGVAMVVVIAVVLTVGATPAGLLRQFDWHFFFLGAAFMLLETRSLVTFALLFGTTWLVNALVFFAILASVLLAILINSRLKIGSVAALYIALFALLAINYLVPVGRLLTIAPAARYLLASVLTFAPVFIANIVFSRSFRDTDDSSDSAFASNLIGIMAGGLVEYAALVVGYQALLVPAAVFYAVALLLMKRKPVLAV